MKKDMPDCPIETTMTLISNRWKVLILWDLLSGVKRFGELKKLLGSIRLRQHLAIPGTKVLQFAFDGDSGNEYLPHNYSKDIVAYTGTHDNDTLKGWYTSLSWEQRQYICRYLGLETEEASVDRVVDCFIAIVQSSKIGRAHV